METAFQRSELIIGKSGIETLKTKHVAVFGLGGVGGILCESLIRTGIGEISIFDNDTISVSNLNRQIIALNSTIGKFKVHIMEKRLLDINPECVIHKYPMFVDKDTITNIDFSQFDFVADAIDTISSKLLLIKYCKDNDVSIISSMGTGNKTDITKLKICDISKTEYDPLARVMRRELKKMNIKKVPVLFSDEIIDSPQVINGEKGRHSPGSICYVPNVAGLKMSLYIIENML